MPVLREEVRGSVMDVVTLGNFSSFKVKPKGDGLYDVYMDNKKLKGVTNVSIEMSVDGIPTVMVKMMAGRIDVNLKDGRSIEKRE